MIHGCIILPCMVNGRKKWKAISTETSDCSAIGNSPQEALGNFQGVEDSFFGNNNEQRKSNQKEKKKRQKKSFLREYSEEAKPQKRTSSKKGLWTVYTDGSCLNNPGGAGGWAAIVITPDGEEQTASGGHPSTTNNRMEIQAAIEGLERTPPKAKVFLNSDSEYVVNTMTKGWQRRKNTDLWAKLDAAVQIRDVSFYWVKGHDGDAFNERCDRMAVREAEKIAHERL